MKEHMPLGEELENVWNYPFSFSSRKSQASQPSRLKIKLAVKNRVTKLSRIEFVYMQCQNLGYKIIYIKEVDHTFIIHL